MYSIKVINILCLCQKSSLILNSLLLHIIRLYVATYLVGSNSVKHVQTISTTLMAIHRAMPAFPDFADGPTYLFLLPLALALKNDGSFQEASVKTTHLPGLKSDLLRKSNAGTA